MTARAQSSHGVRHIQTVGRWRHLLTPAASGAWNMALDDALLARARDTGETVLRVYTWANPTLSLGRNQAARGLYDVDRAHSAGIEIVRRPTGGRAVLHHREITYSVTAPIDNGDLRESYERINQLLLHALRALGVPAELASASGRAPAPDNSPCFDLPVSGELTLNGRKLVGSAQYREEGALLQHGSILVDDDQALLTQLALVPHPPPPPAATLRETLGRAPAPDEMHEALMRAVQTGADEVATILTLDQSLLTAVQEREAHYRSPTWTWRR